MRIFRTVFSLFFVMVLLAAGFVVWFCTGSFTYQNSMQKEFVIDEPIAVVCKRAMNIKPKDSDDLSLPRIDMQQAAKNYSLGQPIEVEFDHPKRGTIKAGLKINLEADPSALKIRGKVVSLEPSHFEKFGKDLADIENFTIVLKISSGSDVRSAGGLMQFFTGTGKTVIELSADSEVLVHFRGLGFLRSRIDQKVQKEQENLVQKIEKFLDENLRNPSEEEQAQQKAEEEKPKKNWNFWNLKKQDAPQEVQKPESVTGAAVQDDEVIDVSALDEEF